MSRYGTTNLIGRHKAILDFIKLYWLEHLRSPTVREIASATGISSVSVVVYHLARLEEDGLISRGHVKAARTIVPKGLKVTIDE
jgi:SOS-response transcriptional repressor LexA